MSVYDDLIKHKILLNKYSKGQSRKFLKVLVQRKDVVIKSIREYGVPGYRDSKELKDLLKPGIDRVVNYQLEQLKTFYKYEQRFASKLLQKNAGLEEPLVKPAASLADIGGLKVPFSLYKEPVSVEDAYTSFTNKVLDKTFQIVNDGAVQSLSKDEVISNLENLFAGLIKTQGYSLISNTIAGVSGQVRDDLIEDNPELKIEKQIWVSMLDSNTCDYCSDLDDQVFDIGDEPDWPAHVNCNCELVPYDE